LRKAAPALPAPLLYKALRQKNVKLNRGRTEGAARLRAGDRLDCYLPDEFFAPKPYQYDFLRAGTALRVLYEDENILLLDKSVGLLCHPDGDEYCDTLIGRVQRYLYEAGAYDPAKENTFVPALVNRIDRNTRGIVIAAKTAEALRILNEKMKRRELHKFYLCAVHGTPAQGVPLVANWRQLRGWLRKDGERGLVHVSASPQPDAKEILTNYRVLAERGGLSLLEVELLTGRTHQIRAQFAALGHGLLGDGKYGSREQRQVGGYKKQCLCSWRLVFDFMTPAAALEGLQGLDVRVSDVWFAEELFGKQVPE
jgi:23S rRNA pseudouridine955/2504/2580 synthase